MPEKPDQPELRRAIQKALDASPLSQREFAIEVARFEGVEPYTQQTIAGWLAGVKRAQFTPRRVFAIEKALKLRPGTLSKIEGYIPADSTVVVTVEEALEADPDISSEQAALLGAQLVEARRLTRERRARRSSR